MKIGLLEDELMLREAIKEYLEATGYIVDVYEDGLEAYQSMRDKRYDLYILDINTPGIDGLELLERLHKEKIYTPTIFISAITEIEQISRAYELGCYDYMKKPFHLKELTLHIERLLKISDMKSCSIIRISSMYSYDLQRGRLLFDSKEQPLTSRQSQIVDILASNLEKIIDFDTLRYSVWNDSSVDNATIRAEIHRVRKSLKEDIIESIKGVGYRMIKK